MEIASPSYIYVILWSFQFLGEEHNLVIELSVVPLWRQNRQARDQGTFSQVRL